MRARLFKILTIFIIFLNQQIFAEKTEYICGIATGFPPYQFSDDNDLPVGIDAEITKLVFKNTGKKVIFTQEPWDELMGKLFNSNKIDFLCGAEISPERQKLFDFSIPIYSRNTAIFVKSSSLINKFEDLFGKAVTGDKHSFVERNLGYDKNKIRIVKTESKEKSFDLLQSNRVDAVIAPLEVGNYITKNIGLDVKIIEDSDHGSPVGFMVKKGDIKTLEFINNQLRVLIKNGDISKILKKYQ